MASRTSTARVTQHDRNRVALMDFATQGTEIHDLLVSCYVSDGEGGRPEYNHERRIADGGCRCGYYKPRSLAARTGLTPTIRPDEVQVDYSQPLTYLTTTCELATCGRTVTYANTKLVDEPIVPRPQYPGMTTHISRRVCSSH